MEGKTGSFPLPIDFSDESSYHLAVNEWRRNINVNIQPEKTKNNISAFYRRPFFDPDAEKYSRGYPRAGDKMQIYEKILNEKDFAKMKFWIYDKNQWACASIDSPPIPEMFDDFVQFESEYMKWYNSTEGSFNSQFSNSNDIVEIHQFNKKNQIIRINEEEKQKKFECFHPTKIFDKKSDIFKRSIKNSIYKNTTPFQEKNNFYLLCNSMNRCKKAENYMSELIYESRFHKEGTNLTTPKDAAELEQFGPSKPIRPFKPLTIPKEIGKTVSKRQFTCLLELDCDDVLNSDIICERAMMFVCSPLFLKNECNFIYQNDRLLHSLSFISWRYNLTGKPPYTPHFECAEHVNPLIHQFWSYSVRIYSLLSLIRIFGTLPKCKKIMSHFNSQKKSLDQELSSFIKKNKTQIAPFFSSIRNKNDAFTAVDIIITTVTNESSCAVQFISSTSASTVDFIVWLDRYVPQALKFFINYIDFSSSLITFYLEKFHLWDSYSPRDLKGNVLGFIYSIFTTTQKVIPSSLFESIDWAVILISNIMQNINGHLGLMLAKTSERLLRFVVKSAISRKKKIKNWAVILQSLLGILTANIAIEKSIDCLESEIRMSSFLFYEPSLVNQSLPIICRIGDNDYRIAHASYKVLKAVAVAEKDKLTSFFEANKEVLKATFIIIKPPAMLDMMKFLAFFIKDNINEEQKGGIGFLGSATLISPDIFQFIQFFYECNLEPKNVANIIKKINPRPPEIARNINAMKKLQSVLAKRPTLARVFLSGAAGVANQKLVH